MRPLSELVRLGKIIRAVGFDDTPFVRCRDRQTEIVGVICANTRFEGMLWDRVEVDGMDATQVILRRLTESKFYQQLNLVLLDGITLAGMNVIDLVELHRRSQRPCIAVMRKHPDLPAMHQAIRKTTDPDLRIKILQKAGNIHQARDCYFQAQGCDPQTASAALTQLTDHGHLPESLRLAHLIGGAIKHGESGRRA